MAAKLGRLGVTTVADLINHYPRRYDDFSQVLPIRAMKPGLVTFRGTIAQVAARRSQAKRLHITEAILTDGTGTLKAVWFNQPFLAKTIPIGTEVQVSGKLEFRNNDLALQSPAIEAVGRGNKDTARIVPVYDETSGLTSKQIRGLILPLLPQLRELPETLPPEVVNAEKLMSYAEALSEIHFPSNTQSLEQARQRLGFEELFYLILASLVIKQEIQTEKAPVIMFDNDVAKQFVGSLPFQLTNAQRAAAWQILQDLEKPMPMNRLLEGDVGSGKTVVAAMVAAMAMARGFQVALMVPTEILARQHEAKIGQLLGSVGYEVELILARSKLKGQRSKLQGPRLIVGTHALLSESVEFENLGLVIIDEQHRFGVNQRLSLKQKAGRLPHLLSMTATPIPRSLALTVYGDLDVTVIDELPPGRQPVETKVVKPNEREAVYSKIDAEIGQGRQVFVVCPLIEESDKLGAKSVVAEADRLQKTVFKHRRIGVLHGKLPAVEKQLIMDQFIGGQIDLLVATSVIEVGIDIPNATIMMIEGADRFGLASLHQLRGRIGRGAHSSYCFLLTEIMAPAIMERLGALERTNDGFRLAQIDLEMRGAGHIYGTAQHGRLDLQLADIGDTKLVAKVRAAADRFCQNGSAMVKYPYVIERVNALKTITTLD